MKVNIQKLKELQNYLVQLEPLKVYDIECKSLPQLYYQLAKKINEIIKTVDIFESHNLNIITEFGEKIDKLLDENLIPELEKIMDDMYESGMLKELIDDLLLKDINKRLEFVEGASRAYLRDDWYTPRSIESCELGVNGIPSEINHGTYEQMFAWKLDKLVAEHPDIMSKSTIGMDTSGIYPIYRYIMEPEDYDRTILLLGGVHGDERTSFFGICEIMELICKEAETDGNLALIRQKTKVVAIPVVNPYGFVHNSRRNVNGVDLNRNCDYLWEEYTTTKGEIGGVYYKGIAPDRHGQALALSHQVADGGCIP